MADHVYIGQSDVKVNPIGLGAMKVGGHNLFPNLDEEMGKDVVRAALDHGIDFIDTAFIYGPERSEELIGQVIKERGGRDKTVIATKAAHDFTSDGVVYNNQPDFLKKSVEDSLRRLQTNYIDLFYIHDPDKKTPEYEAVGALKEMKDEGKIRAIGVSNFSADELKEADKDGYVDALQSEYNLINREAEAALLPYTKANGLSFIPYFPLAAGLLTGKFDENTRFDDHRKDRPQFQGEEFKRNLAKVDQLRTISEQKGVSIPNLVLAWYLTRDSIDAVIPGAKNPEQVIDNLKTLDAQLTNDEAKQIDGIFA